MDPIAAFLGPWASSLTLAAASLRIFLSVALSTILGSERATKRHSAGLRTFILVGLTSTVAMLLDMHLSAESAAPLYLLSAASIIGSSIICVNSVLFSSRSQIKGLTTSVGLWATGLIGLSSGAGYYTVTLVSFAALLCCLALFPRFEIYLKNRSNHFEIHLELTSAQKLPCFTETLRRLGIRIDDIELNPAYAGSGLTVYTVAVSILSAELKTYKTHSEVIEALSSLEYVSYISES